MFGLNNKTLVSHICVYLEWFWHCKLITQYYNCSESKAEEYLKILSQSQLDIICNSVIKGQNEQSSREDGRNPS